MKKILKYLSSTNGRTVRFICGAIAVSIGLFISPFLVVVGILPLLAGIFDVCIFAPFFKLHFDGEKLRDELSTSR